MACSTVMAGGIGELLARGDDVDHRWPVVAERLAKRGLEIGRVLDPAAEDADGLARRRRSSGCRSSVPKLTIPAAFISSSTKFSDELLKTITFTGSRFCSSVISSPNSIVSPPSPASATTCRPRIGSLRADRVRKRARHGAVVERADQPTPPVHRQVAGCPDHRRANIDSEHRVVSSDPIRRRRQHIPDGSGYGRDR